MDLYFIKRYLILADQGVFEKYECPLDEDHGRLYPNMDVNEKIFLYCIYCNYKKILGLNTLQEISRQVLKHEVDSDLRHLAGLE